jgi:hypothetical protein
MFRAATESQAPVIIVASHWMQNYEAFWLEANSTFARDGETRFEVSTRILAQANPNKRILVVGQIPGGIDYRACLAEAIAPLVRKFKSCPDQTRHAFPWIGNKEERQRAVRPKRSHNFDASGDSSRFPLSNSLCLTYQFFAILLFYFSMSQIYISATERRLDQIFKKPAMRALVDRGQLDFLRPAEALCSPDRFCDLSEKHDNHFNKLSANSTQAERVMFWDDSHLTVVGALRLKDMIQDAVIRATTRS